MQYVIGFLIPAGVDQIENWKDKLENEIKKIELIMEKFGLSYTFPTNIEATGAAQIIKENLGDTEIIIEVSVEPMQNDE
jgi:hypothetical protein